MRSIAAIFFVVGALAGVYALFLFDPSVETSVGRVNNIGLLSTRQNILIAGCAVAVVAILLLLLGKPDSPENRFSTAIEHSDLAAIKLMLESKVVDVNGVNQNGRGWLQHAVLLENRAIIDLLLQYGADPKKADRFQRTSIESTESKSLLELFSSYEKGQPSAIVKQLPEDDLTSNDLVSQLSGLAKLRGSGALSDDEFQAAKRRILGE